VQVEVSCSARVPAPSGRQGDSTPYFVAPSLKFTVGSGTAPSGTRTSAVVNIPSLVKRTLDLASLRPLLCGALP